MASHASPVLPTAVLSVRLLAVLFMRASDAQRTGIVLLLARSLDCLVGEELLTGRSPALS